MLGSSEVCEERRIGALGGSTGELKKERGKTCKTIGQLTLERDFLQDAFRASGRAIPIAMLMGLV